MNWISTNDLNQWANSRECQDTLPKLISRLVRASASKVTKLNFPSGDHVQRGGWDGILICEELTSFVPEGVSLWEFGAGKGVTTKLNADYKKRTENPLGFDPLQSTFVFVTPRAFKDKDHWIEEKKKEGKWADIRIYDDEIIHQWIDSCPSVGIWLATMIRFPDDCESADSYWEAWSTGEEFNISPELLLIDRRSQVQELITRYNQGKTVVVRGPSKTEALAFIIAAFLDQADGGYDFLSTAILVDTPKLFKKLVSNRNPLNLILNFEELDFIQHAVKKGHKVFIPIGSEALDSEYDQIVLPSISKKGFVEALINIGISSEKAESYTKECARSITIFRRQRMFDRTVPQWAKDAHVIDLIPLLLLGGWNENHSGDITIVENISKTAYNDYIAKLDRFLLSEDSPIIKLGHVWKLKSPLDCWTIISKHLLRKDLEILRECFRIVLSEINPKFNLQPERRPFATLHGIGRMYSSELRNGLCQSLIFISLYEESLSQKLGVGLTLIPISLIGDLLSTSDFQLWMSIEDQLPLLAEAAPKIFLERLETQLTLANSPILELFKEERGFLFPQTYIPGLLWAIEDLAWFPDYFPQSCLLLARLAEIDPGGTAGNRPINSLKEIFKAWNPGTYATIHERLAVLRLIAERFPISAWDLLVSLLPSTMGHDFSLGTRRPSWLYLLFAPNSYKIEIASSNYYNAIFDLLLSVSGTSPENIAELIKMSQAFPIDARDKILDFASKNAKEVIDYNFVIWNELRRIIHDHSSLPDANWALPAIEIEKYKAVRDVYTPPPTSELESWLFEEHWPKLPDGFPTGIVSFEDQEKYVRGLRVELVKKTYTNEGIHGIFSFNERLNNELFIAEALVELDLVEKELKELFTYYSNSEKSAALVKRFTYFKTFRLGPSWLIERHSILTESALNESSIAEIYSWSKQSSDLWVHIESLGSDTHEMFWQILRPHYIQLSPEEMEIANINLLWIGRPFTALSETTHHVKLVSSDALIGILERCSQGPYIETPSIEDFSLKRIFEELNRRTDVDDQTLVLLEWQYLPLLMRSARDRMPLRLKIKLTEDPQFFNMVMEVIHNIMSTENLTQLQAENHFRFVIACEEMINSVNTVPGEGDDKAIDKIRMKEWLETVRQEAISKNRIDKVDFKIGRILGNFCKRNHGASTPVYEYIEEIKSKSMSDGFSSGIMSTGKATWRAVDDGGRIEWKKREETLGKASELRITHPYVSSVYSDIANYYKEKAEREDREALYQKFDED